MGFWSSIFNAGRQVEQAARFTSVDLTPEVAHAFGIELDPGSHTGKVSRSRAITVAPVKRARNLTCGPLGGMPIDLVGPRRQPGQSALLTKPEKALVRSVTMTRLFDDLFFEGIAWWRITDLDWRGFPAKVKRVPHNRVSIEQTGRVYIDGRHVPDRELIRFDSPLDPVLTAAARAIRTLLALDEGVASGAFSLPPVDYFAPAEGADPAEDEEVQAVLDDWAIARRQRRTGYVPLSLEYHTAGWSPEQLQLSEMRRQAIIDLANAVDLDPEDLGVSTTSRTYQNAQDRRKDRLDFSAIGPLRQAVEDRLSEDDVTPQGYAAKFNVSAFLRTDDKTRMEVYKLGREVGAYTGPEIRELEDKPPLTDEEEKAMPKPGRAALASVHPIDPAAEAAAAFTTAGPALRLDAPGAAAFEVDADKRTIAGLLVPYGKHAYSMGQRWQFAKGTLVWSDVSRVKLLLHHDFAQAVGVAVDLDDREDGLYGTFRLARGPEGDRALELAEDGVLDGLSIGVGMGGKYRLRAGVQHAVSAPLQETSLTPVPAFDDARVQQVAASAANHHEGAPTMTAEQRARLAELRALTTFTAEQATELAELTVLEAENPEEEPDFSAATITEAIAAGFAQLGAGNSGERGDSPPAGEGLEHIEEAPAYRFDGTAGEHDFSTDLINGLRFNDGEAMARVVEFMADALDGPAFVDTSNVATLNPARQRPDMYVDRLVATNPLYAALHKGSITDQTPFIFPKFGTATGLVDDHTEGTEPTEGTFTATNQTVTPTPVSGKASLTREVWDQGGNPQVSGLVWREMQRAYFAAMEGKVSALLQGASPTTITLPAGAEDDTLVDAYEAMLIDLQFIPGGSRFTFAPTHQTLFTRLGNAKDASGRKLLPQLGPANATGTARPRFSGLDIAGVSAVPAHSLAGTNADGVRNSYLLAPEDVHVWNTPPKRLDFQTRVASIEIGIWGYVATAISRLDGVRRIAYNRSGA